MVNQFISPLTQAWKGVERAADLDGLIIYKNNWDGKLEKKDNDTWFSCRWSVIAAQLLERIIGIEN